MQKRVKTNTLLHFRTKAILLFLLLSGAGFSQNRPLIVSAHQQPLSKVLIQIRDSNRVRLSFNDYELSKYDVTIRGEFNSPDEAFAALLNGLPYSFGLFGDVYVIYKSGSPAQAKTELTIKGLVADKFSGEALPYSTVVIDGTLRITDFRGRFTYVTEPGKKLSVQAKYLGYFSYDTTFVANENAILQLVPSSHNLNEIRVDGKTVEYGAQAGSSVGETRLNSKIGGFMPGGSTHSVYNLLRLQPGIVSTHEQTTDLIIWGSQAGQSRTVFDGITLYSLRSNNEFISTINPLLVKDVLINKGGFGAQYGDRVGGIIDIQGIDGSTKKSAATIVADNVAVNSLFSVPVTRNSSLTLALRQSILPSLHNNLTTRFLPSDTLFDVSVIPQNSYSDVNLKYSGSRTNGDHYYITALRSIARYTLDFATEGNTTLTYNEQSRQRQHGLSGYYGTIFKNGTSGTLRLNYSLFDYANNIDSTLHSFSGSSRDLAHIAKVSRMEEVNAQFDTRFSLTPSQFVDAGVLFTRFQSSNALSFSDISLLNSASTGEKVGAFIRNHIDAGKSLTMDIGIRVDYTTATKKLYFQPRIKGTILITPDLKFNASWGIFNQYINLIPVRDAMENFSYLWELSNGNDIPVLQSDVAAVGISYAKKSFIFNAEAYYKRTEGLGRYVTTPTRLVYYDGKSLAKGVDVFIKREINKHVVWLSYSLSENLENFPFFETSQMLPSAFDQRHELKVASVFNFNPLFLSFSYIYGSGFLVEDELDKPFSRSFNRVDAGVFYRKNMQKVSFETGLSVLNVFNSNNYSRFSMNRFSMGGTDFVNVRTAGIPIYPNFMLKLYY